MSAYRFSGPRVRELREKRKLSREELAARCGKCFSVVRYYETGHTAPSMGALEKLAEVLKVHPGKFFVEDDQ